LIPKKAFPAAPANQIPAKILSFVQWFEAAFGADSGAPSGAGADGAKAIRDKIHDNFSGPTKPVEIARRRLHVFLELMRLGVTFAQPSGPFPRCLGGFLRLGRLDTK
jgi:hypothetical protein